ncbi:MAG: hypothetical protein E7524_07540 [Ruminococcaceae bacterium]|nr:hypothetical protein [Oscillospiraceae bacterium]
MKLFKKNNNDEQIDLYDIIFEEPIPTPHNSKHSPDALTSEEIIGFNKSNDVKQNDATGALDALKKRLANISLEDTVEDIKPETEKEIKTVAPAEETATHKETLSNNTPKASSLLDKCMPYIIDEDGSKKALDTAPLYKLQSVADILKSDSEKVVEKLSQSYDISFENLGFISDNEDKKDSKEKPVEAFKEIKNAENIKQEYTESKETKKPTKVISDIDFNTDIPKPDKPEITFDNSTTVTFTPIASGDASNSKVKVSTHTKAIDLTNELVALPETAPQSNDDEIQLEQSEFEDFVPKTEFTSASDIKKLKRKFSIDKRNAFLSAVFTFLLTALLAFARLPFMSDLLLSHTFVCMIVCSSVSLISVLLNFDMFLSIPKILSRKNNADITASLATACTIVYAIVGIIKREIILDILLLLGIILLFRSLTKFFKASYMLENFRQISKASTKKAVKLINDQAITFSMAKNAIEGDVLIAAAQKTEQISDFMKYSTYGSFLGGRLPIITIFSVIASMVLGIAGTAYFDGAFYGIYAATAVQLLTALPTVFLIEVLPLYRTSKKLSKSGAMIMGKIGAEHLEMANAMVLSSNDLFPNGTVTLHQMKVLSENTLDDTLVRAASLTEYMGSTLAPIFKQIVSTGNIDILPDTDTVKYEDRMGISGWVDNRLLFIGNRTLMEAHGIEVPSLEVDRKILRQGFFPVYVATQDKACALLIIQYSVDPKISHELRALTKIGVTLLINNTDPNLSEPMICDYLGLYEDSVKVMSAAGCHMYKNTVAPTAVTSAPAVYKGSSLALASILNCATKIKRSNILLTILYVLSAVLGIVVFAYTSFGGSGTLLSDTTLLIYGLASTAVSYFIYLTERP